MLPARLRLRLLQAAVVETPPYGCTTYTLLKKQYEKLKNVHSSFLTRGIEWNKRTRTNHPLSYTEALHKTDYNEILEITLRKPRVLSAGIVMRTGDNGLMKRVMEVTLDGKEGYTGGQELD